MITIITIDGGLGRTIAAIPALLKYHKNHLDEEWYVMIHGWDFVTWGIPELQERTFNPETKGTFDYFWKADKVICPEPYKIPAYYRNEISLSEAFDVAINNSEDHSDLPPMQINLSSFERRRALEILQEAKEKHKKNKTIVIQPYGSAATPHSLGTYDDSLRSIPKQMLDYFINNLLKDYNVIFMGAKDFHIHNPNTYKPDPDPNLREWMAIIGEADYFIGCDSCGQHICKALNKKASVVIAGTHKVNVTYDEFHIIERDVPFYPDAMRISGFHAHMSSRLNEPRIQFTQSEIEKSYQDIIKNIGGDNKMTLQTQHSPKVSKSILYS